MRRQLQNLCKGTKHLAGAPKCNATNAVLTDWLQKQGLLEGDFQVATTNPSSRSSKGSQKDVKTKKSRIANFFDVFPQIHYELKDEDRFPGLNLEYHPHFFTENEINLITTHIGGLTFIPKRQFNMYVKPARVTSSKVLYAWYSDLEDAIHNFSRAHLNGFNPLPFTETLEMIRTRITETTGTYYNSVLINFYKDGKTALSAHSDDDKWLGSDFNVPSLSFGARRDIIFRGKKETEAAGKSVKLDMESGSLTVMKKSSTQRLWTHEIPVRAKKSWRINMTFRNVDPNLIPLNPRVQKEKEMKASQNESVTLKTLM